MTKDEFNKIADLLYFRNWLKAAQVLNLTNNRIKLYIHVVVGNDGEYIYIITAYFPNTTKFEDDLKTRKGALIMCMFCKCDTVKESTTTHVVNYKGCVIVVKNVPCEECEQCGEKFYTDEVAERLERMVDAAKKLMQEISVIDYSRVA